MNTSNELGLRAFARHVHKKASYISQLKGEGRLVLSDDGKKILVAESIQRIADTMDPAKFAVSARHAANRASTDAPESETPENVTGFDSELLAGSARYQDSRAIREEYLAKAARRDYELSIGKLMNADDVLAVITSAVASLRSSFENIPDILGPQLAAVNDESQVRSILVESIEHSLEEASRKFYSLSKHHPQLESKK